MPLVVGDRSPRGSSVAASVTPIGDRAGDGSPHDPNVETLQLANVDHRHHSRDGGESDDEGEDATADLFAHRSHVNEDDDDGVSVEDLPDLGAASLSVPHVPPTPPHRTRAGASEQNSNNSQVAANTSSTSSRSIPGAQQSSEQSR